MKSPILWMGGKSRQLKKLLPLIPEHTCYCEVFGGAAWLLFAKQPAKCEIYNDIDSNLVNFFRVVRDKPQEFLDGFDYELTAREFFNEYRLRLAQGEFADDIEQAHVFYYVLKTCFAGRMTSPTFGTGKTRSKTLPLGSLADTINAAHDRLLRVSIEHDDFRRLIPRYDSPDTFFFLDPPYFGLSEYPTGTFSRADYEELAQILAGLQGKFLLTVNEHPLMHELFGGYNTLSHDVTYSMERLGSNQPRKSYGELIIINYPVA